MNDSESKSALTPLLIAAAFSGASLLFLLILAPVAFLGVFWLAPYLWALVAVLSLLADGVVWAIAVKESRERRAGQ
jgi:hypothetical protein